MTLTRNWALIVPLVALAFVCAPGCRRKASPAASTAEEKAAAEQRLMSEIRQTLMDAETAFSSGQTNEAVAKVEAAQNNPQFAAYRSQIFEQLLHMLLRGGDESSARQRALQVCGDPVLADGGCGLVYRNYREHNDLTNAVTWANEVLARTNLVASLRRTAFAWSIDDNIALGADDQALGVLSRAIQALAADESVPLSVQAVEALLAAGRLESVDRVLTLAGAMRPCPLAITHLVTASHVRLRASRGEWEALTNDFAVAALSLPDGDLDRLMRGVFGAAQKAGKRAVVDGCAEIVIFNPAVRSNATAVASATRVWIEQIMAADKDALPARLNALLRANVPIGLVTDAYTHNYYEFTERPAALKDLMAIGERLMPLAADEETRNEIKTKLLDGCFLLHDYDRALVMLEAGIPGRDEQWHKTAIIKVKAHRALENKNPREAVKCFREFMDCIRSSKDAEISDPVTGMSFTKEMILGRNAKRIGDILAGIPDADEAAKAYTEAHALYSQALDKTKDPEARKVIESELAQLPK